MNNNVVMGRNSSMASDSNSAIGAGVGQIQDKGASTVYESMSMSSMKQETPNDLTEQTSTGEFLQSTKTKKRDERVPAAASTYN